jgi:hypothetical protein
MIGGELGGVQVHKMDDFCSVERFAEERFGPVQQLSLREVEAAWLAALVDGEGTIGIYKERRPGNTVGYRYLPTISVYNTHKGILDKIASIVPGIVQLKDRSGRTRPLFKYTLQRRLIPQFLHFVRPHLVIKQDQADLILAFIEVQNLQPVRGERPNQAILDRLYEKAKKLNERGVRIMDISQSSEEQ